MNRRRCVMVMAALGCSLAGIAARAVQVSVLDHQAWQRRARQQQQRMLTVPSTRGEIRSADGYILATSEERAAIQVDTDQLRYPHLFAAAAAQVLHQDAAAVADRLNGSSRAVWLAQRVAHETAEEVRTLDPSAVILVPDSQRVYPLGSVAAQIIGFVGREELRTVGRAGFEHHFNDLLAGQPQRYLAVRDAVQRHLSLQRVHAGRAGYDLELTILARLQAECESALEEAVARWDAAAASAVVLDPFTGTVLALASVPSFDPAAPGRVPRAHWRLRPVQDAFEPGSTAKIIVMAAALASGAIDDDELIDCRHGGIQVAGQWVRDHADPGLYTGEQIIAKSSNAGIITLAQRLSPSTLWRAFDAFGLGRGPEIGFPAEASGLLPHPKSWSHMTPTGLAIGQEVTASPLQIALAYSVIANGGWLPRPRLLATASAGGRQLIARTQMRRRVLGEELAGRLSAMLERTVSTGTGTTARVAGFRVAGKTGTAQRSVNGRFDDENHVAWFAGFLPLPDPRVTVVVAIENPRRDFWASAVAAPVFARIAATCMHLLDVVPNAPEPGAGGGVA